ncbi:MAG TPA: tetratricopeptide repeat protein [Phycisphaerales bacterium]|nr:tetratricopeptide repeat protein [Phycisphaerales bacterium]
MTKIKQPNSNIKLLTVLALAVCTIVAITHWPALSAKAISFDDEQYFIQNALVQNPGLLSARQLFAEVLEPSTVAGYYQPLTMISLMSDWAMGARPDNLMPLHINSLCLHLANTILVIILLYKLFNHIWIAAAVGLLFGIHPMTVEVVTWIGERKTLLSTFFALWSLLLYLSYTKKGSRKFFAGSLLIYLLAVLSKPTSLPLPIVMILMDYWPLERLKKKSLIEKIPMFIVAGVFAVITYLSQSQTYGAELPSGHDIGRIPLILCHNIIFYLYKIVWPLKLSSHYGFPEPLSLSHPMVLAGVIGTGMLISLLVISLRWTRSLLTGWLIFFVSALPTMQVVGFSPTIASDKHAYLPSIGLLMVLAVFMGWIGRRFKFKSKQIVLTLVVLALASAEVVVTRNYLTKWQSSVTLFKHMMSITPNQAPIHYGIASALRSEGKLDEAIEHLQKTTEIAPYYTVAHNDLGSIFKSQGRIDEAIKHYRQALQLNPNYASAYNNIGSALATQGKFEEAIDYFSRSLQINSNDATVYCNLALSYQLTSRLDKAINLYRKALEIDPEHFRAKQLLKDALAKSRTQ